MNETGIISKEITSDMEIGAPAVTRLLSARGIEHIDTAGKKEV